MKHIELEVLETYGNHKTKFGIKTTHVNDLFGIDNYKFDSGPVKLRYVNISDDTWYGGCAKVLWIKSGSPTTVGNRVFRDIQESVKLYNEHFAKPVTFPAAACGGCGPEQQPAEEGESETEDDLRVFIEQAFMAGQAEEGVDPSYSSAQHYCDNLKIDSIGISFCNEPCPACAEKQEIADSFEKALDKAQSKIGSFEYMLKSKERLIELKDEKEERAWMEVGKQKRYVSILITALGQAQDKQ